MEDRHFDRITATLGAGGSRRGALAALLAGAAAILGPDRGAAANGRCKKCTVCPQQACCSCRAAPGGKATSCFTIEGLNKLDAENRCIAACGGEELLFVVNTPFPGFANVCDADQTCGIAACDDKACPIQI